MAQGMKGREMTRKSLSRSESGAAIAIAAVLLLGFAFTAIAVVKLNYTPEWKIDAEREHSYEVWSSMEEVKTRADIFSRFMYSDTNYPYGLSATVPFSMGGGEIPVFEPSKSNSKLAVNDENCTMIITLPTHPDDPRIVDCGGITYYSENTQYPDQVFRYENGALILSQGKNSQMKREPSFDIERNQEDNYTLTINAINLIGGPASMSSSTSTALRLTGCSIEPVLNSDVYTEAEGAIHSFDLTVRTRYIDAWATCLNSTAKDAGLEYDTDYRVTYPDTDCVCLSFLQGNNPERNNTYNLSVNKTVLCAELGRREGVLPGGSRTMRLKQWYYFDTFTGIINGAALSPSPNPVLLRDYDSAQSSLPSGNFPGVELIPYNSKNEFSKRIGKNENIDLSFKINGYTEFESTPSQATILMVYRYERENTSGAKMEMSFAGANLPSINKLPDNWRVYNQTVSISPSSPSDLAFNLKVSSSNNEQGTFHIDYLTFYLS